MNDEVSQVVYSVIGHALRLRDRLDRGDTPSLEGEQAALRRLVEGPPGADRWPEYVGDDAVPQSEGVTRTGPPYLGIRYALTCWLDELFILHSPWDAEWNERKLEATLYGTNDRAWRFWEQAKLADGRSDPRELEVFYLCAMLGFRGELREETARFHSWAEATRARVAGGAEREWPGPPHLDPPTAVQPLRGRDEMKRMVIAAGVLLLLTLPALAYLVVRRLAT